MRLFRRTTLPTIDAGLQPSAPPPTDSASSRLAPPDGLTGSNSREHERAFSAFLDEIGAGERKRQTDFLSFCRSVEEAFDVAQAERRAQLSGVDHSIRAETREVHNSLLERAAAAETERDRLSAQCLSASSVLGMQLAQIGDRYAAVMGRLQCRIGMAQTMGLCTTEQLKDLGLNIYFKLLDVAIRMSRPLDIDQPPEPHVQGPINIPTATSNIYPRADDSAPTSSMDQPSHLLSDSNILTRLLDGLVVPAAGMDPPFMRQICHRRQEELYSQSTLMNWGHEFEALQSHLQSKFLAVLPEGSAIGADPTPSTLVIISLRWRTANARRAARLKYIWATSLQELNGLVFRHNQAVTSKLLPYLLESSRSEQQSFGDQLLGDSESPREIFLRRFPIGGPLPVLPLKTRKEVDIFQQTLSALRVESDEREGTRQAHYERMVLQWQSRAAQAERRRQSLFDDAIDRLRAIAHRQISDLVVAGEQLALDLELAFIVAQSSREETMRLALQSLDQQLQEAAEDALRSIEAAISDMTPETSDQ